MSTNLWTEAPMVRTFEGEVIILVMSTPAMTPAAARETAAELLRAADEAEREYRRH